MNEPMEQQKVLIDIDIIKPVSIKLSQAELEVIMQTTVEFFKFHFNLVLAQKKKDPNPNLN